MPAKIESTTEQSIRDIKVPVKGNVVPYGDIIDTVTNELKNSGYNIYLSDYKATSTGTIVSAVHYLEDAVGDSGFKWAFTWSSTYDKSQKFKCAIGVWLNANDIMFYTDNTIYSSHPSQEIGEIGKYINYIVNDIKMASGDFLNITKELEARTVDLEQSAEILGRLFIVEKAINVSQLSTITSGLGATTTLHELYLDIAAAMQDTHPSLWMDNHSSLYAFFFVYTAKLIEQEKEQPVQEVVNIDKPTAPVTQMIREGEKPTPPPSLGIKDGSLDVKEITRPSADSGLKTVIFV